jgi:hypothetical protein
MTIPTTIAVTLLLISLALIAILAKTRTIGPPVMVGVVLGGAAGVSATSLITGWLA